MGLRDRFFTPATTRALISWRIGFGVVVAAVIGLVGGTKWILPGLGIGLLAYAGTVYLAMPKSARAHGVGVENIDPFTVGEPWRQIIMASQSAARQLDETVRAAQGEPLHTQLADIANRLNIGLLESWAIARTGDHLDDAIAKLNPTRLRANYATAEKRQLADDTPANREAITSLKSQLATVERLKAKSKATANQLRATQIRFDELVARANEVRLGMSPTEVYVADIDSLIEELDALHLAVEEVQDL